MTLNLWSGTTTRGPLEGPCTSGAAHGGRLAPRRRSAQGKNPFPRLTQPGIASASIGYRTPGMASVDPRASNATGGGQRKIVTYWEEETDDVFVPAPPGGKTLKINVDLMLWRCRQARLKAQLTLDEEERRELMREAESGLRRCLVLDPADARTYVVLGKLLMVQRRFDEARMLYAEGVANTGNMNAYIWSAWGWLEFKTGNLNRARQLFDAAIVVDDTHACAWHKWGLLERSEGNYLKARDLWMKGIQRCKRKPQSQNAYLFNALAVMAAQLKRVSEARAWFDEGTSTMEGVASVALWQAWAVLEANQGDPTAVRYLFKKALQANPRSRYVHLAWALWERKSGNILTCQELLKRGSALNPTDAAIYQARALIEWKENGNAEKARGLFEQGIRADPGHLPLWQAWGCMEAQLGDLDAARRLFQQGVWADPRSRDTVWVLHAWGCLERNQDNMQLARELFKAAIKVDPKAEKVWFTWIAMEADAGLVERADELRIRQAEQQWEFEVPAGFTTRPGGAGVGGSGGVAGGVAGALSTPLATLRDTLTRFFTVRSSAAGGAFAPNSLRPQASQSETLDSNGNSSNSIRNFLPADFTGDLSLDDVLPMTGRSARAGQVTAGQAAAGQVAAGQAAVGHAGQAVSGAAGRARQKAGAAGADAAALLLDAGLNRADYLQQVTPSLLTPNLGTEDDGG